MSIWEKLAEPFGREDIHWRVGFRSERGDRGSALAYIEARAVMDRLDTVVGPEGWASEVSPIFENGALTGAKCRLTLFLESGEVWREDIGAASEGEALKGAASDALKRAAVQYGIGRYLYNLPGTWVDLDGNGRLSETPELPDWALPAEEVQARQQAEPAPRRARTGEGAPARGTRPRAAWRN